MPGDRYSVAELFRAYAAQKARDEWYGDWGSALIYRPIAILATPALLRLSIGATPVTLVSLAIVLSLPLVAILGGSSSYLIVGLLAILVAILDCVDGTIARATGTISKLGHYLDFLTDVVFRISLYSAIGYIADIQHTLPLWVVGRASWLAAFAALLAVAARLCRVDVEHLTGSGVDEPVTKDDDPSPTSTLGLVFSAISGIDHLLPFFVVAAGAWNMLGWLLLWLLFYSALDFLYTQFGILRRLR